MVVSAQAIHEYTHESADKDTRLELFTKLEITSRLDKDSTSKLNYHSKNIEIHI